MRAIQIERYGGPEVLLRNEVPVPAPGPGEVLVRVSVAGVNFMDIHTRQGKYANSRTYPVPLPCTLGMEGAGEVAAVGDGVDGCAPGDRVAWCISWGSYADYAVVPARLVAPVPDALSLELAGASMFQGSTAHYLVNDVAKLEPTREAREPDRDRKRHRARGLICTASQPKTRRDRHDHAPEGDEPMIWLDVLDLAGALAACLLLRGGRFRRARMTHWQRKETS